MEPKPLSRVDFRVPTGTQASRCNGCGERVYFVRHPRTGNVMPLDFKSAVRVEREDGEGFETRCESHHAHCIAAGQYRRKPSRRSRR